jgi:hypothetical protein
MKPPRSSRWNVSALGIKPVQPPRSTRWLSNDLSGPLPARVVQNLVVAIKSLPTRGLGPEIDEEAWWQSVLTDWRGRPSNAKRLPNKEADLRLDRVRVNSLTFSCKQCGHSVTLTVAELCRTFGPDRNVRTIRGAVIKCNDKRARRDGYECPITYGA